MPENLNPYSPSITNADDSGSLLRTIGAMSLVLIGTALLILGVIAIGIMIYVTMTNRAGETIPKMVAGCTLYSGTGLALIMSGLLFWRRHDRGGAIGIAVAFALPLVLFSIFGFE